MTDLDEKTIEEAVDSASQDRIDVSASSRFPVIVADPPWDFITWSDKAQKSAKQFYSTMSVDEIAALPVADVAAENAILLLWATWPNLLDAIRVGQAWGFQYKTLGFIWVKRSANGKGWHQGLGYYTRANSEPCLLFTRGKVERQSKSIHQVIVTDEDAPKLPGFEEVLTDRLGQHSAKPETFYHRVEKLVDDPYLELFARRKHPGWTVLGNEIDGQDIADALRLLASNYLARQNSED